MLDAGRGMVFLHHAVASWPAWPEFAGIVGGRFHYQPADLAGRSWPDSGYVFDVQHTVEVLEPDHPITAGLDTSFDIVDELYLFPVFEEDVVPLMRSRYDFSDSNFFSADLAIRGTRNSNDGWSHPPEAIWSAGSNTPATHRSHTSSSETARRRMRIPTIDG